MMKQLLICFNFGVEQLLKTPMFWKQKEAGIKRKEESAGEKYEMMALGSGRLHSI